MVDDRTMEQILYLSTLSTPIEQLRAERRKMAIEAHNAEVDAKKAEKKKAQRFRKEMGIRRLKPQRQGFISFAYSSIEQDLRG